MSTSNAGIVSTSTSATVLPETGVSLRFRIGEFTLFTRNFRVCKITDAAHTPEDASMLMARLPRAAQAVMFPQFPMKEANCPRLAITATHLQYVPAISPNYCVSLRGTFEDYLKSQFAAKARHNLKRCLKQFKEFNGDFLDVREYRAPEEMQPFQALAAGVSSLTYQHRLLRVGLPADAEFLASLIGQARLDRVRGYILFHDDTPVAFAYCYTQGLTLHYHIIGHDPAYNRWSPGTVLLLNMLQSLFAAQEFEQLDFGPGEAPYKAHFSTSHTLCGDIYCFRRTVPLVFFALLHAGLGALSTGAGLALEKLRLKATVRKLLRRTL
jgi:CelD/BcsL family acetyltransferase involved in cellulose biosynthesis